jgi:hypothetical protein
MIRPTLPSDKLEMMSLFSSLNLFDAGELEFMSELVDNFCML